METQFADIKATLSILCEKMSGIERSLHELRVENTSVREELAAARREITKRDETIAQLSEQVNRIDQSSRANSIRIFGLQVNSNTPPASIPKMVLDKIIGPIINHAREVGELPTTACPTPFLIDHAFAVPTKKGGLCPVIVKLANPWCRNLIFKHKKAVLPQITDLPSGKIRSQYTIVEDLTANNHAQLRALSADPRVRSVWSFNGQIRFKPNDSESIYKVKSLSDTYDSLVSSQLSQSAMSH
jgi:carbonic anhydrase